MSGYHEDTVSGPTPVEPDLSQFTINRLEFSDEYSRAHYVTAVEELREVMEKWQISRVHARLDRNPVDGQSN